MGVGARLLVSLTGTLFACVLLCAGCLACFSVRCANSSECPAGYQCQDALCTLRATADGGNDAAIGDARPADHTRHDVNSVDAVRADAGDTGSDADPWPACGTVQALQDAFVDRDPAPLWWHDEGDGYDSVEANGELTFFFYRSWTDTYTSYDSQLRYRLRDGTMRIEVSDATVAADQDGSAWFRFSQDQSNRVGWRIYNGALTKNIRIGGQNLDETVGPFIPTTHRWWQVRETAGQVYFETSTDGQVWTDHGSIPTPVFADLGTVQIGAGHYDALAGTETAVYADFNAGLVPARYCSASTLQDPFTGSTLRPDWEDESGDPGCAISSTSSGLVISAPRADVNCSIQSARGYALDESGLVVHVAGAPALSGMNYALLVRQPSGLWWEFGLRDDSIVVYGEQPNTATYSNGVSWTGPAWLQVRKVGGALLFSAKNDLPGAAWNPLWTVPVSHPFDPVRIGVEVNVWDADVVGGPFAATFQDFNLP